jgi:hypothetical protein
MLWQGAKWRILKNFNVQNEECHNYVFFNCFLGNSPKIFLGYSWKIFEKIFKSHDIFLYSTLISLVLKICQNMSCHYKKMQLFKRPTWPKCPHWPKGMSILKKGLGHEKHMLHLTKVTFLTKC